MTLNTANLPLPPCLIQYQESIEMCNFTIYQQKRDIVKPATSLYKSSWSKEKKS